MHCTPYRDHALRLAEVGPVLAVQPRGKVPLRGSHGVDDATRDRSVIESLRATHPNANVGIACGHDDLVVLDFDPRNGGLGAQDALSRDVGLPDTVTVLTPGTDGIPGKHLYYRGSVDSRHLSHIGLDVQAARSYVVGAGSVTPQGEYRWLRSPADIAIAELPSEVEDWLRAQRRCSSVLDVGDVLEKVPGRKQALPDRTWDLIRRGFATGAYPERDAMLGAVIMAMARARWTFREAVEVLFKPSYAAADKLREGPPAWRDREPDRTWKRCVAEVLQTEELRKIGGVAIGALDLQGRSGTTDRKVLHYLLDKAAWNPGGSGLRFVDNHIRMEVKTTQRTMAADLDISTKTAWASLKRLREAPILERLAMGDPDLKTPSVYRVLLPVEETL